MDIHEADRRYVSRYSTKHDSKFEVAQTLRHQSVVAHVLLWIMHRTNLCSKLRRAAAVQPAQPSTVSTELQSSSAASFERSCKVLPDGASSPRMLPPFETPAVQTYSAPGADRGLFTSICCDSKVPQQVCRMLCHGLLCELMGVT